MNKNNFFVKFYHNTHLWIVLTCIGVWILVFQNIGTKGAKDVYVIGGELEAEVSGNVSVDNTVDVDLRRINGHRNCFYGYGRNGQDDYYMLPVTIK